MEWIEAFIGRTLEAVPECRYRTRTENELRDHMRTEYEILLGGGRTPEEAQAEVLRTMGEPERLREEYEAAWRHHPLAWAERTVRRTLVITGGCLITGVLHLGIGLLLLWLEILTFEYDRSLFGSLCDAQNLPFYLVLLFLVPFSVGGLYLHFCARRERHPVRVVTAGLLAAWVSEKAPFILLWISTGQDWPAFVYSNPDIPVLTPDYMVVSFVGCILLGQFFGRFIEKEETETA